MTDPMAIPLMVLRIALIAIGLYLWFLAQPLLCYRPDGTGVLGDWYLTLPLLIATA